MLTGDVDLTDVQDEAKHEPEQQSKNKLLDAFAPETGSARCVTTNVGIASAFAPEHGSGGCITSTVGIVSAFAPEPVDSASTPRSTPPPRSASTLPPRSAPSP